VDDHGSVAELDERLREGEGKRAQTGAEATNEDEGCDGISITTRRIWRCDARIPFMLAVLCVVR